MGLFDSMYGGAGGLGGGGMNMEPLSQIQEPMGYEAPQYSGGMDMGNMQPQQQFEPSQMFQQLMQQMQPQNQMQYQPSMPEQPSMFKRIISGALIGLGGGMGAPDAGSAFSGGFGAVMAADEANRQRRMQEQQMAEEAKYRQMQTMMSYVNIAKGMKELGNMDKVMAMEEQKLAIQNADLFAQGSQPMHFKDESEALAWEKENGTDLLMFPYGNGTFMGIEPTGTMPPNSIIKLDPNDESLWIDVSGRPKTEVYQMQWELMPKLWESKNRIKQDERNFEQSRTLNREQQAASVAGQKSVWDYQLDNPRPTTQRPIEPGNLTDAQKSQIYNVDRQLRQLDFEMAPPDDPRRIALEGERGNIVGQASPNPLLGGQMPFGGRTGAATRYYPGQTFNGGQYTVVSVGQDGMPIMKDAAGNTLTFDAQGNPIPVK